MGAMRLVLFFALVVCCSKQPEAVAASQPAMPQPSQTASPVVVLDAAPTSDGLDAAPAIATADAGPVAPPAPPVPKVVLHMGDSMVGGYGGLTKALESKFKPLGSKFVRDWQVSVSILTFDHDKKMGELLKQHDPDLFILTLGANDVFVPFPASLAGSVASIARKASAGGRRCFWITPPLWKPDTGITEVIKKNAIGCRVFDSSGLKISRGGDGIHPTDRGGAEWADKFWDYYQSSPGAPAAPLLDESSPSR